MTDNVFLLSEKTSHLPADGSTSSSLPDSLRTSAVVSPIHQAREVREVEGIQSDHAAKHQSNRTEQLHSPSRYYSASASDSHPSDNHTHRHGEWSQPADSYLSQILPSDLSIQGGQKPKITDSRSHSFSSPPSDSYSYRRSADSLSPNSSSLNTSAISQLYLPSAAVEAASSSGPNLFALATVGVGDEPNKRRANYRRQQDAAQQQQPSANSNEMSSVSSQSHLFSSSEPSKPVSPLKRQQAFDEPTISHASQHHSSSPSSRVDHATSIQRGTNVSIDSHAHTAGVKSSSSPIGQPSTTAQSHPSAKLSMHDLYDPALSLDTNYHLTQKVQQDQYAPNQYSKPKSETKSGGGWTPADSAAAASARIRAKSASSTSHSLNDSKPSSQSNSKPPLHTGAVRRPNTANAQQKVPVLNVTSGPVPVVVAKVNPSSTRPLTSTSNKKRSSTAVSQSSTNSHSHPIASPSPPSEAYSSYSQAYAAHMSPAVSPVDSGSGNVSDLEADEWDGGIDSDNNDNYVEGTPKKSLPGSRYASSPNGGEDPFGSYSALARRIAPINSPVRSSQDDDHRSLADSVAEHEVETQIHLLDHVLESKLRDEINLLRQESGFMDLFEAYESTITQLHRQNAALRAKVQRLELNPGVLKSVRSPHRPRSGDRRDDSIAVHDDPPVKQAHYRVLESSYRKLSDEHVQLQDAYASLQKQARKFTLQSKQCVTLQSRVQEHVGQMRLKEKELANTRKQIDGQQVEIDDLKSFVFDLTQQVNSEQSKNTESNDRIAKLKKEVATLTDALFAARSAAILQQVKPKSQLKRSTPSNGKFLDRCTELGAIETLFIEARKPDTPINLVHIANRKGLELCNRLRTQIDLLDREKLSTQENEKALLLLVMKLQEKNSNGAQPRPRGNGKYAGEEKDQ